MTREYLATQYPLSIAKGAHFQKVWVYYPEGTEGSPKDWTGWTGEAQLRSTPNASGAPLLTFTVSLRSDGSVEISATAAATEALKPDSKGVWDLYVKHGEGEPERLLAGTVAISFQATHD